jgi:ZIP family zinc transporter
MALLTAVATGLGVVPFAFVREMSPSWRASMVAAAGGMMISASVFSLAVEALARGSAWEVTAGMIVGAWFFARTAKLVEGHEFTMAGLGQRESRQAVLIFIAMFIHSIPEGVAIGVGYATGEVNFGFLLALAIAVHNVPEGVAVSLPLRARGVSLWVCAGYAIVTSLPQPLFAVPSFLLVSFFQPLLPAGLGFAGGAMIYLVIAELVPDALEGGSRSRTAWSFLVGLVVMLLLTSGLATDH